MKWSDINLETYAAVIELVRADTTDIFQRDITLLSLITGKSEAEIEAMKIDEFNTLRNELYGLLSTEVAAKYNKVFKVAGRGYKVAISATEISATDLMDISLLKITPDNLHLKLAEFMAIVCKPYGIISKFQRKLTYQEKVEVFKKHMTADIAMGVTLFFWTASIELLPLMTDYSIKEMQRLTEMVKKMIQSQTS